ncbi:MAG: A1 family peptidase, partial [Clostridia bacterium]|nr:A1 family peptidase [Clostridia bacterium]
EEERRRKEEEEKDIRKKVISPDRMLILNAPYQDNEDFIISPLGLGTPVNFLPLQIDTTTYKTWVASVLNKESPSTFSYDKKESETSEEKGEWDTVVDEEGAISGNVIYDKANLGKFQINRFKFIEAVEYEDNFKDFKNGKMGLGNCHYADRDGLDYCLLQKLKDNGSIERRIFSMREFSDTHGEIVIGDITSTSKENDYPLLSVISQDEYDDIEDDEFKMSWITKVSHVLFRDNQNDNLNKIFNNNIYIKDGLASFDSSSHYIEAPYAYIDEFEEKMFNKYYPNICRKVNSGGAYMFLCDKEKYDDIKDDNKDLTFVIVMDGNGFEIPMNLLFEQTRENDYEFFVHFKDYEQNIWNLGHPFFHQFTIIFDQDNQEIGVDGKNVYDLKDQTESALKKVGKISKWWKIILYVILGLLVLAGIFYLLRKWGIKQKLDNGVSPSLVDNESVDDLSFAPGQNVQG